jgi:hypothetical protein
MSSGTTAEPIHPDAPVTKTRMRNPPYTSITVTSADAEAAESWIPVETVIQLRIAV